MKLNDSLLLGVAGGTLSEDEEELELLKRKAEIDLDYSRKAATIFATGFFKLGISAMSLIALCVGVYLTAQKGYQCLQTRGIIDKTPLDVLFN